MEDLRSENIKRSFTQVRVRESVRSGNTLFPEIFFALLTLIFRQQILQAAAAGRRRHKADDL